MKITKNLTGTQFVTTSARGMRTETEKDKALRAELLNTISEFNRTQEERGDNKRFAGFCIGFEIDGDIYAALFDTETALQRVKWDSQKKILQPIGTQQARDLVAQDKMQFVCTLADLDAYAQKMRYSKRDRGNAFQKYLDYLNGYKDNTDKIASLKDGGDKYLVKDEFYEVKFMRLGTSQASCRV